MFFNWNGMEWKLSTVFFVERYTNANYYYHYYYYNVVFRVIRLLESGNIR